jgi:hypothetical protein
MERIQARFVGVELYCENLEQAKKGARFAVSDSSYRAGSPSSVSDVIWRVECYFHTLSL